MLTKLLPVFCGALITISISISSWTMKEVVDLRSRVASLEATHVSPSEMLAVWKDIAQAKMEISRNTEKISALPNQGPPAWFIEQVKGMETRLNTRTDKLEIMIDRNATDRKQVIGELEKKLDELDNKIDASRRK
jgi:hypothetical protein